jgi:hypothetical protein
MGSDFGIGSSADAVCTRIASAIPSAPNPAAARAGKFH